MASLARDRVKHLWAAAHAVHEHFPELAQEYASKMHNAALVSRVRLADSVSRRFCAKCSSFLLPGVNCSMRLSKTKESRGSIQAKDAANTDRGTKDNKDQKGKHGGKKLVARKWWDGFNEGKYSRKKNNMVCTCQQCGSSVHWGGSDPPAANERRHRRGGRRRDERFRDAEKAEAALRLDHAREVMKEEALCASPEKQADSPTKMLPSTISRRAEAAVDRAYQGASATGKRRSSAGEGGQEAGRGSAEKTAAKKQRMGGASGSGGDRLASEKGGSAGEAVGGGAKSGGKKSLYEMLEGILGGPGP